MIVFVDTPHEFNAFLCPTHVADCDCPNLEDWACNPYKDQDNYCVVPEHQVGKPCSDENCLPKRQAND